MAYACTGRPRLRKHWRKISSLPSLPLSSTPFYCSQDPGMFCACCLWVSWGSGAHKLAGLSPMPGWVKCCLPFAHLALGRDLLVVTVRGVPRDLAGPQCDTHYSVRIAYHQQGEEVDQHSHTDVVPATRWMEGVSSRNNRVGQALTVTFLSICH